MKRNHLSGPQNSLLFRVVSFCSRMRFRYLLQALDNPRLVVAIFVSIGGTTALGIITVTAYLTELPLLFPPLGPSAFILFHTPMSITASPRNVILSHYLALAVGLLSLWLVEIIYPDMNCSDSSAINLSRVIMVALSMGLIGVVMIAVKCVHPPAAASALIAAMGYFDDLPKILGLLAAVLLLVLNAFFFNRILGGLPYPIWRQDPKISRSYGLLAGIPDLDSSFWQQLTTKIFQQR